MGAHNEDSTHKIVGCTMYCLIFAKLLDWPSRSFSSIGDGVFSLVRGESASRGRPKLKIPQDMSRGGRCLNYEAKVRGFGSRVSALVF